MGVHFDNDKGWVAQCKVGGKLVNRKGFRSKEQAAAALELMRGGAELDGIKLREAVAHIPGDWLSKRELQRRKRLQKEFLDRRARRQDR